MAISEQPLSDELDRIAAKAVPLRGDDPTWRRTYVEMRMSLHADIVMDVHGDTRHTFNPESGLTVREAMKRFDDLFKTHVAGRRLGEGRTGLVRSFSAVDGSWAADDLA